MNKKRILYTDNIEYVPITRKQIIENVEKIKKSQVGVWRLNPEKRLIPVSIDNLDIVLGEEGPERREYLLYIRNDWQVYIRENKDIPDISAGQIKNNSFIDTDFLEALKKAKELQFESRVVAVKNYADQLKKIIHIDEKAADLILEASINGFLFCRVSVMECLKGQLNKRDMNILAEQTHSMIATIIDIFKLNKDIQNLMSKLENNSSGVTINHINRVFIKYSLMLLFYNNAFSLGIAGKIRGSFTKYRLFYKHLLKKESVDLQDVFKGGMRVLTNEELLSASVGALLHDIGKLADIEYHEGNEGYDREKVLKHVYQGYNILRTTTTFSKIAMLMVGDHHGYYLHSSGYGITNDTIRTFMKDSSENSIAYCMSYDADSVIKNQTFSTFQTKLLEIVDIHDALTDPMRGYHARVYKQDEAMEFMKKEFVDKNKIDPILFDIFKLFIEQYRNVAKINKS